MRLYLVDVGVLRLTGHGVPDPAAHFLAQRRLDSEVADAYTRLMQGMRFGGDDAEPGGGGGPFRQRLDPNARRTIETVALASKRVRVDGEATVRFRVPAYEGRLRLVAVGAGAHGTAAASREILVKAPISLTIHSPRAVAPGDTFVVPLSIRGEVDERKLEVEGLTLLRQD